jgi:hypothetical protein
MLCCISDDGQENDTDELLGDACRLRHTIDGVYEELCSNSNKLQLHFKERLFTP